VTRSTSYTPLDGNADQVEGLPTRTLKTKPSFSSFVEQDEELDYRNQDQEQDVGVEETVIKKKKTSRKSNKKEVDLGLGGLKLVRGRQRRKRSGSGNRVGRRYVRPRLVLFQKTRTGELTFHKIR
jgi:hypothetical protein